jgi:hypothetical protein
LLAIELDMEHSASDTSFIASPLDTEQLRAHTAFPPIDAAAEALFEEARRRTRRRRRRWIALMVAAMLLTAALIVGILMNGDENPTPGGSAQPLRAAPRQLLTRDPYMGVSCRTANSIACDRVGLAVWTRRSARAVRATITGRTIELNDPDWSQRPRRGLRRMFAGFLDQAGLRGHGPLAVQNENGRDRWTARHPVSASVQLVITYRDGTQRKTRLRVGLAPGWG